MFLVLMCADIYVLSHARSFHASENLYLDIPMLLMCESFKLSKIEVGGLTPGANSYAASDARIELFTIYYLYFGIHLLILGR